MCSLISFLHNIKTLERRVYNLVSHSKTMEHFGIKNNDPEWREGHYNLDGTIEHRINPVDEIDPRTLDEMLKKEYPTFISFLDWCLKQGVDIEVSDNYGRTPLHWAVRNGHTEVVKLLFAAGAQIEVRDNDGRTPLILAALHKHTKIMKLLLKAGAQVEVKDNSGSTPLHWAVCSGNAEVVKLLLAAGAPIEVSDNYERTPLSLAVCSGNAEVVKILKKYINRKGK